MVPADTRPGDVLADRYRLTDLLSESAGGRFWRANDSMLQRDVAVHILDASDPRASLVREAARTSATVLDRRLLRVLDIDEADGKVFVVNEWGSGTSLDILLANAGPLAPATAAWVVAETADPLSRAHEAGLAHGRLVPENVLIDHNGAVRLIGFGVDAAIEGLPPGRIDGDVTDLGGVLHACLTGKWAGVSRSAVPAAPTDHGRVLRPRQVRAGIPRTLDSICDHVLNQGTGVTAEIISDTLREFLGEDAGAAAASLARIEHAHPAHATVVLPQLPDPPVKEQDFASAEPTDPPTDPPTDHPTDEEPSSLSTSPAGAEETSASSVDQLPTQAGLPIFHDGSDEVTWLSHHPEKAPPPPPFEPPPERPLFAPERDDGAPARRPRPVPPSPVDQTGAGFWPFQDSSPADPHARSETGSGILAPVDPDQDDDDRVPGRSMLRLAMVIAACLLVLLAGVIAFNLGRGKGPLGQSPTTSSSSTTKPTGSPTPAAAAVLKGVSADDFDPQGRPPVENSATVGNVVDGNPATSWVTSRYKQNFGPDGLKIGVGVVLDLGRTTSVHEVDLTMLGAQTAVSIYVSDAPPTSVPTGKPSATATVQGATSTPPAAGSGQPIVLDPAVTGRYVTVWLTSLPAVSGGFRGAIAEAVVKGG